MKRCLLLFVLLVPSTAAAHAIDHRVESGAARIVTVSTPDGRPFAFEQYEVHGPDDRSPFQIGRTDRDGRVAFVPDRDGEWTVKVWSDDGHGVTATVAVTGGAATDTSPGFSRRRLVGTAVGLALILCIGGLAAARSRKGQR